MLGGSYLATPIKKVAPPYHYTHYALAHAHGARAAVPRRHIVHIAYHIT